MVSRNIVGPRPCEPPICTHICNDQISLQYGDIYIAFVSYLNTYGHLDNLYFIREIRVWGNVKGGNIFHTAFHYISGGCRFHFLKL